ncbi:hypothetical protein EOV50_07625 [Salmonella enterica subsp. enterica serovar Mokola]|nr:hypothetical protein [Salmonella enterica subsp. enterica serovar Enteritidis]ECA6748087.1 hypothetical protein [Salmonella enterica subsp. enterica serovar Mokola]ECG2647853.1 hypothetical protein [Salmonella enterica subsp. enterica serovar Chailey]EBU6658456.1 hypothetical protein [Salmonella enterica subsp. enterica serovar Enteritidis]EBV1258521.1 hypothetical protein [Salmonella enterica subsp. enterica serovar Enteritidis]
MSVLFLKIKNIFFYFSLRKILILILLFSLIGIDKEEYFEEGNRPWVPRFFIKHKISFYIIFEVPVVPYYILYNAELSTEQSDELQKYCQIRYGVSLPNCKNVLFKRMIDNGFYKPE